MKRLAATVPRLHLQSRNIDVIFLYCKMWLISTALEQQFVTPLGLTYGVLRADCPTVGRGSPAKQSGLC